MAFLMQVGDHDYSMVRLFVSLSLLEGMLQKTYIMSEGTADAHMLQKIIAAILFEIQ